MPSSGRTACRTQRRGWKHVTPPAQRVKRGGERSTTTPRQPEQPACPPPPRKRALRRGVPACPNTHGGAPAQGAVRTEFTGRGGTRSRAGAGRFSVPMPERHVLTPQSSPSASAFPGFCEPLLRQASQGGPPDTETTAQQHGADAMTAGQSTPSGASGAPRHTGSDPSVDGEMASRAATRWASPHSSELVRRVAHQHNAVPQHARSRMRAQGRHRGPKH